jgi:hypothetical protein
MRRRKLEQRAWDREHSGEQVDAEVFRCEILPGLRDVPISMLMQATGLSRPYCAAIRQEKKVPHPRHWDALQVVSIRMLLHGD